MLKLFKNPFFISVKTKYESMCSIPVVSSIRNISSEPVNVEFSFHSPVGVVPSSELPVVILHGLLGSRMNWRSIANVVASKHQKQVYTLDARNHGDSPHSKIFDYPSMASDVCEFIRKRNLPQAIIIGHSMGGRTAMTISLTKPHLVEKLVVVDVSPLEMPKSASTIHTYISSMQEVIKDLPSHIGVSEARQILNNRMASSVPEMPIRQFLLTNLTSHDGGCKWKANVDVIAETFSTSITSCPSLSGRYDGDTLFICGGDSPYVSYDDHEHIRTLFPKAKFVYIPGAGHWVHSEKPQEFLEILGNFLEKR